MAEASQGCCNQTNGKAEAQKYLMWLPVAGSKYDRHVFSKKIISILTFKKQKKLHQREFQYKNPKLSGRLKRENQANLLKSQKDG